MDPVDGEQAASGRPPVIAGMPADPLKLLKRLMEQIKVRPRITIVTNSAVGSATY